jgi:hypothetical protein
VVNGRGYEGERHSKKRTFGNLGGRKHYWRLETIFPGWYFLVLEFGLTVTGVH